MRNSVAILFRVLAFGSYGFIYRLLFLFEVLLLYLSLHIEVCHFKTVGGAVDARISAKWSFFLVRAEPLLSFPYVSIKTPFLVTSNDTG